jgi:hypothetical protein
MERQWKHATRWAAVGTRAAAPAASRWVGNGAARVVGGEPRAERAFHTPGARVGRPGGILRGPDGAMVRTGAAAGGPSWSASVGWETRAASAVGAAMVHWVSTEGDRATTVSAAALTSLPP